MANTNQFDLVTLLYCARSGSTFFAKQLSDHCSNVAVVPEFRFPLFLLWKTEQQVRALTRTELGQLLEDDYQLHNLFAKRSTALQLVRELEGKGTREIILGMLRAYLAESNQSEKKIVVIKNSEFALVAERLLSVFPEMRFVHIIRDPRGVANSMISSLDPYDDNRPMARGDALYAAWLWKRYICRVRTALSSSASCLEIKYERLLSEPALVLEDVRSWLGATKADDGEGRGGESLYRITGPETLLHKRLDRAGDSARVDAWRSELSLGKIVAIQRMVGKEMRKAGYDDVARSSHGPLGGWSEYAAWLAHGGRTIRHYTSAALRSAGWIVSDPRRFRVRSRQLVMRVLGKN